MAKQNVTKPPRIERSSAGLRDALFDELDGLRSGSVSATQANATAKIANAIVDTVTMEMTAYKLLDGKIENQGTEPLFALPTMPLGIVKI